MMRRYVPSIIISALLCVAGLAGSISLLVEYPSPLAGTLLRSYPGLFLWPLLFLPLACSALVVIVATTTTFIWQNLRRPGLALAMFGAPVVIAAISMSAYEWFNGKYAVFELAPTLATESGQSYLPGRQLGDVYVSQVRSFSDLALSIRNHGDPQLAVPECRFGGTNYPEYLASTCFCSPINQSSSGQQCEHVRRVWYDALGHAVADAGQRSYTYYFYRISFTAMTMVFAMGLMAIIFMSLLERLMINRMNTEFRVAKAGSHVFAILTVIWWFQRAYFNSEQFTILPARDDAVTLSILFSVISGAIVVVGTLYAFGQRLRDLRHFHENYLVYLPWVAALLLSVTNQDVVMSGSRLMFGVDSSVSAIVLFTGFVYLLCFAIVARVLVHLGLLRAKRKR